jgi:hypothetical protein
MCKCESCQMDKIYSLAFIIINKKTATTISRNYPFNNIQIPQIGLTYTLYLPYPAKQVLLAFNHKYGKIFNCKNLKIVILIINCGKVNTVYLCGSFIL